MSIETRSCSGCGFIAFTDPQTGESLEVKQSARKTGERTGNTKRISEEPSCSQNSASFKENSCRSDADRLAIIQQEVECELFIQYQPTKSPSEHVDMIGQHQILDLQHKQHELNQKIEKATESRHVRNVIFMILASVIGASITLLGYSAIQHWSQ